MSTSRVASARIRSGWSDAIVSRFGLCRSPTDVYGFSFARTLGMIRDGSLSSAIPIGETPTWTRSSTNENSNATIRFGVPWSSTDPNVPLTVRVVVREGPQLGSNGTALGALRPVAAPTASVTVNEARTTTRAFMSSSATADLRQLMDTREVGSRRRAGFRFRAGLQRRSFRRGLRRDPGALSDRSLLSDLLLRPRRRRLTARAFPLQTGDRSAHGKRRRASRRS